jgi:catechol 2,3-dioxygenase-like lactoylglutathione lyase family enzyme
MNPKLTVVTLWAEDVQQTTDFYQDVLGLPLLTMDRGRPHFDFGGGFLIILPGQPYRREDSMESRFPVIAFAVEDLHNAIHHLKAHGVEMPWGVEQDSDSRWVMFYDPGGNLIEVAMFGNTNHHPQQ